MEKLKTSGYAPVNGLQMYYEIYGEGKMPLVLIHGGGSTIETSFAVSNADRRIFKRIIIKPL